MLILINLKLSTLTLNLIRYLDLKPLMLKKICHQGTVSRKCTNHPSVPDSLLHLKKCSYKPITEAVSNIFKMIFAHVRRFHNRSRFYSGFHKFWVVENSFPVVEKLNKINKRNIAKSISTFDFSTLYTKLPRKLLIEVLDNNIDFVFKSSNRNRIGFSKSSVYWTSKCMYGCIYFAIKMLQLVKTKLLYIK